jgi:hypothetical protein
MENTVGFLLFEHRIFRVPLAHHPPILEFRKVPMNRQAAGKASRTEHRAIVADLLFDFRDFVREKINFRAERCAADGAA